MIDYDKLIEEQQASSIEAKGKIKKLQEEEKALAKELRKLENKINDAYDITYAATQLINHYKATQSLIGRLKKGKAVLDSRPIFWTKGRNNEPTPRFDGTYWIVRTRYNRYGVGRSYAAKYNGVVKKFNKDAEARAKQYATDGSLSAKKSAININKINTELRKAGYKIVKDA